ncbi:adenosylcobinamide amidohydrolase [Methylopila sp. 73B]|uniref:adenosylcobinamide amidohydrolase n=1 Tax=Methylopila sp. 73B TaxID=1120792 RepID=UPI00037A9944|nr:adenosylcobinamide amidohydrolase [Methylopila sp. 73B]
MSAADDADELAGDADALFLVSCARPWLAARFVRPQRMLSWALARPGFQTASEVAWLEVEDDDLPVTVDPAALLASRMREAGFCDAVGMMTSRDVRRRCVAGAASGGASAGCLATVGLGNAARVGAPSPRPRDAWGTVNLLVACSVPLTDAALVEALSIAVEARTAAIMASGRAVDGGAATGTGTDCVVVAAPLGGPAASFAGLHTDVGVAIGGAVYESVKSGACDWMAHTKAHKSAGEERL